jgi:hypothetical protein
MIEPCPCGCDARQAIDERDAEIAKLRAEVERLETRCDEIDDERNYAEERNAAQWEAGRVAGLEAAKGPLADFQRRAEKAEAEVEASRAAVQLANALQWFHDEVMRISTSDDYDSHGGWGAIAELYYDRKYKPIVRAAKAKVTP